MSLKTTFSRLLGAARHPEGSLMRATWKGALLAESDDIVVVEGNHYFPADSLRWDHLRSSEGHTICPWKGQASYHHVTVDGEVNPDAAWFYPDPSSAAASITSTRHTRFLIGEADLGHLGVGEHRQRTGVRTPRRGAASVMSVTDRRAPPGLPFRWPPESRAFVDHEFAELRHRRRRPAAWATFLGRRGVRSTAGRRRPPRGGRPAEAGLAGRVAFACADAERLPVADARFDAVVCECAFCTFPNKRRAAGEMARPLRQGGVLGLADVVRWGQLAAPLGDLLAWISCADARAPQELSTPPTSRRPDWR